MISKKYNDQMGNYLEKLFNSKLKLTNADRIRSMTDDELATFLINVSVNGGVQVGLELTTWDAWLKQESKL